MEKETFNVFSSRFFRAPWDKGAFLMDKTITVTKKLVGTAAFAALAFVISFIEFPVFPAAPFFKLDFSLVFILLAGFTFGPFSGLCASAVKELLRFIVGSSTGGVGEIANLVVTIGFVMLPTVVYVFKKGLPTVMITLAVGCVIQVLLSLLVNRFVTFPLYMGEAAKDAFNGLWQFIVFFNLIKSVAVSVITVLVYKRISGFIKSI